MISSTEVTAAIRGDVDSLQRCCVRDLLKLDERGRNLAHHACESDRPEVLDFLSRRGVKTLRLLFKPDFNGWTPLHTAALHNSPRSARALSRISWSKKLPAPEAVAIDSSGFRPVTIAISRNNTEVLRAILDNSAGVSSLVMEHHEISKRPILDAAQMGWVEILGIAMEHLDMMTMIDHNGENVLHRASRCPRAFGEILSTWPALAPLLAHCDRRGRTPAHIASMENHPDTLYVLGKLYPETLSATSLVGMTAASVAAAQGHTDCLSVIYAQGGCVAGTLRSCNRARHGIDEMSICHVAAAHGHVGVFEFVFSCHDLQGMLRGDHLSISPAIIAARSGHIDILKFFHKLGSRFASCLFEPGPDGRTCAAWAARNGFVHIVSWLYGLGGAIRDSFKLYDKTGVAVMGAAILSDHASVVSTLVELSDGTLLNDVTVNGDPAASLAITANSATCFDVIADHVGAQAIVTIDSAWSFTHNILVSAIGSESGATGGEVSAFEHIIMVLLFASTIEMSRDSVRIANRLASLGCTSGGHAHLKFIIDNIRAELPFVETLTELSQAAMHLIPETLRFSLIRKAWLATDPISPSMVLDITTPRDVPEIAMVQIETADIVPGACFMIKFSGEPASGEGLRRAWITDMMDAIVSAEVLTQPQVSDGLLPDSRTDADEQSWFRVGILIGASILTGEPLGVQLGTAIFAGVFSTEEDASEIYSTVDQDDFLNRVQWINNCTESEWEDADMELCPIDPGTGAELCAPPVKFVNRSSYTDGYCRYMVLGRWVKQWELARKGVKKIIGQSRFIDMSKNFRASELKKITCGDSDDPCVDLMSREAFYMGGLTRESMPVQWLWRWARERPGRPKFLLQFCTGSRNIPSCGLRNLSGYGGSTAPFSICRADGGAGGRLPYASTCLNRLMLPPYSSYESLVKAMDTVQSCDIVYDEAGVSRSMPPAEFM